MLTQLNAFDDGRLHEKTSNRQRSTKFVLIMKIKNAENAFFLQKNKCLLREITEISTHRMSTRRKFKRVDVITRICLHRQISSLRVEYTAQTGVCINR